MRLLRHLDPALLDTKLGPQHRRRRYSAILRPLPIPLRPKVRERDSVAPDVMPAENGELSERFARVPADAAVPAGRREDPAVAAPYR